MVARKTQLKKKKKKKKGKSEEKPQRNAKAAKLNQPEAI